MALIKSAQVAFAARPHILGDVTRTLEPVSKIVTIPVNDPQQPAQDTEIELLQQALEAAQAQAAEQASAIEEAYERGLQEGARTVTRQATASIELLTDGIDRALAQLAQDSSAMEQLAVALATTALTQIFGPRSHRPDMVLEIIRHQFETLAKDMVLHIDVSKADFNGEAEHNAAFDTWTQQGISLKQRDDLNSGDCEMRLRLGVLDVGLDQQWGKVRAHLEQLISEAPLP